MPAPLTRNLISGGAGFLGSHLVDRLMQAGEEVICLDNYFTGRKANISQWTGSAILPARLRRCTTSSI
jgi:UDP-glucuronate decarboxylase